MGQQGQCTASCPRSTPTHSCLGAHQVHDSPPIIVRDHVDEGKQQQREPCTNNAGRAGDAKRPEGPLNGAVHPPPSAILRNLPYRSPPARGRDHHRLVWGPGQSPTYVRVLPVLVGTPTHNRTTLLPWRRLPLPCWCPQASRAPGLGGGGGSVTARPPTPPQCRLCNTGPGDHPQTPPFTTGMRPGPHASSAPDF